MGPEETSKTLGVSINIVVTILFILSITPFFIGLLSYPLLSSPLLGYLSFLFLFLSFCLCNVYVVAFDIIMKIIIIIIMKSADQSVNLIFAAMASGQIACTYASLILHDDGIVVTAEKIAKLVKTANVTVESYWPSLFAKLAEKRNIDELLMNIGSAAAAAPVPVAATAAAAPAAPALEEKKEEPKEESDDDDLGFSLFD